MAPESLPSIADGPSTFDTFNYSGNIKLGTTPDGKIQQGGSWVTDSWTVLPDVYKKPVFDALDQAYGKDNWDNQEVSALLKMAGKQNASQLALLRGRVPENQIPSVFDLMVAQIPVFARNGLRPDGKLAKGVGGSGGVSVSFQKSVRLTDPGSARKLVDTALGQYLGRSATSEEQKQFLKALNVQEQDAPTMTKSTTNTSGRSSSTSSVTTGGFDPSVFAEEYAQGQEGAGEFKAATSLLDTFINAIGAKV